MLIAITGATGFLGRRLCSELEARGHSLARLSRRPPRERNWFAWDPERSAPPEDAFRDADAVIHLAGEPVAQRWTSEVKGRIRSSRVAATEALVQTLSVMERPPRTLISASAIGYYGSRGDEILTEDSPPGAGFLPEVCREWEAAAEGAERAGLRVVRVRIGVVLHPDGGALKQMLPPFRLGLGGPIAGGQAWMSWIHLDDLTALLAWAVESETVSGAVNATAPNPVRNAQFTRELGAALRRPAVFPVPGFALKLLYGEMAEVILGSARVRPEAAEQRGFCFRWPDLHAALQNLLR